MASFLMIGGSGRTGGRVTRILAAAGHQVTIASRRPRAAEPGIEAIALDLTDPVDDALMTGIDGVVVSVEPPMDPAGADAVLHRGVAAVAEPAAASGAGVVLVSQIYVTRAEEHPEMAGIITARARGEEALRASGASYAIVRPSWLTDAPADGVRLEQGDTGDGRVSRDTVAGAVAAALVEPAAVCKTFEIFDDPSAPAPDWPTLFTRLTPDT